MFWVSIISRPELAPIRGLRRHLHLHMRVVNKVWWKAVQKYVESREFSLWLISLWLKAGRHNQKAIKAQIYGQRSNVEANNCICVCETQKNEYIFTVSLIYTDLYFNPPFSGMLIPCIAVKIWFPCVGLVLPETNKMVLRRTNVPQPTMMWNGASETETHNTWFTLYSICIV